MSCVFAHVSNIISSWQRWGSAGHESWHVSVQSSPEPHRVQSVLSSSWQTGRGFCRKFRYHPPPRHICLLRTLPLCFLTEEFSRGHVTGHIRRVSVTWSWSPSSWPSSWRALSSSAVTTRCQEWPPPSASVCHLYIFSEETSEEERDKYFIVAKRISSRNQIWVVNR